MSPKLPKLLARQPGRRFALLTFFADAAGAARERQMIEQAVAAGRTGVTLSCRAAAAGR